LKERKASYGFPVPGQALESQEGSLAFLEVVSVE
jgi:hypothetical protein